MAKIGPFPAVHPFLLRRFGAPPPAAPAAPPPAVLPFWIDLAIKAIIGLLITGIGTEVIKTLVGSTVNDRAAIEARMAESDTTLEGILKDIDRIVLGRLTATQVQSDFAAANNVTGFILRYPEYYATVQTWNSERPELTQRISQYARCGVIDKGEPEKCPGYDLFNDNPWDFEALKDEKPVFTTASDELRFMHYLIADSTRRPIVPCAARAAELMESSLKRCGWATPTASNCILDAIEANSLERICSKELFYPGEDRHEALAAFGDGRFRRVVAWVNSTKEGLIRRREERILTDTCEAHKTPLTWGWLYNCSEAVANAIKRRPMYADSPFSTTPRAGPVAAR